MALFLPWLRQHGSTRHRGANVGLGIQMVFLSVLCWCFLGDGAGVGDGVGVDATVDVVGVLVWLVMVTMCNTFLFVKLSRHSF